MSEKIYKWAINIIVGVICAIAAYPLIYVISASLMTKSEWIRTNGIFLFPSKPTLLAYKILVNNEYIFKALFVSVLRAASGAVLHVSVCCILGYALSRPVFFGKKFFLIFFVITMIYGGGLIPTFIVVDTLNLLDNFLVYIIPGIVGAWSILVFKQTFENTPRELEESAQMDGASELVVMAKVVMPVNMPTVVVLLLFSAVGHWNSWFDAFLYINTNKDIIPLQLFLRNAFVEVTSGTDPSLVATELAANTFKMAIAVIGTVPILCVYPFFQKHFVKGVYMGAVKE